MTTEAEIGGQYDRITQMLRQEASTPVDYSRYAIANMTDPKGYVGAVDGAVDRKQQAEMGVLQMFEAKKARGDKQAQALDDKINLFTGGDPEGTALILEQLHADPEQIDPGNAYQVMTKIAGIVKRNGYVSPQQQEQKLNMRIKQQQLSNASKGPEAPASIREAEAYMKMTPEGQAAYDKINGRGANGQPVKPMPPNALKQQNDTLEEIGIANSINANLSQAAKAIDSGKLDFGPLDNPWSTVLNKTGNSTENSRNYGTFKSNLQKLRNDSLRLNKGTQTEGDATRAWDELIDNINDTDYVRQRIDEIMGYNEQAAEVKKLNVDNIRANYQLDPYDFTQYEDRDPSILQDIGDVPDGWSVEME